jgi:D-beta-D-heptose 7-phosphate kinase/D-beta-D-heptose 1-phosphate adenosyltransferase
MHPNQLREIVESLGRPRILVVGDLILDRYVTGAVERISPEAPIPVLSATQSEDRLGGAGNVAANLRAMESPVDVIGVVGDDSRGRRMRGMFEEMGCDASGCVVDSERPTTEKTRMISGVQQMLRVDWEKAQAIAPELEAELVRDLPARVERAQAVILSDYGKGVLTQRVLEATIFAARKQRIPVLVDPKGSDYSRYRGATLVTPNRKEAEEALGRKLKSLDDMPQGARDLMKVASLDACVITLGGDGMFHMTKDGASGHVPTVARQVFDVTGAGDTVISHLAIALGDKRPLEIAVLLANHAAGIVVGKRGAASVTRGELSSALGRSSWGSRKIALAGELDTMLARWRKDRLRIVFTNGCFDVLHAGHVQYLRFARTQGDVLIVGVNDDDSVRRMKGPTRPVNPLGDRLEVLAALEMVDGVTSFSEDTPAKIVERVSPGVLVKGEDWKDKGVVGREWVESHGGVVVLAPLLAGRSTTAILERGGSGGMTC